MMRWLTYLRDGMRIYRFKSLFWQSFRLILIGLALPLMIVLVGIYAFSQQILRSEIEVANMRALSAVENVALMMHTEAQNAVMKIVVDEDVLTALRSDAPQSFQSFERVRRVVNTLELSRKNAFFDSCYLYIEPADYLITNSGYATRMPFADDKDLLDPYASLSPSQNVWVQRTMETYRNAEPIPVVSLMRRIETQHARGLLVLNVEETTMRQLFGGPDISIDGGFALLDTSSGFLFDSLEDADGRLTERLLAPAMDTLLSQSKGSMPLAHGGEDFMVSYSALPGTTWVCILTVPYRSYAGSLYALQIFVIVSLILALMLAVVLSMLIGERLSRPLRNIVSFIDHNGVENPIRPTDNELNYILMHIITLYDDNKVLEQERLQRFGALRQAQAHTLQAQLTPHFLNNTLQAIQWLVLKETKDEGSPAGQALVLLSDLARDTMEDRGNLSTLRAELRYVERYIALQKLRHLDALKYRCDVPEDLLDAILPRLCLQPLIENAIEHKQGGNIRVEATREGDILLVSVIDDGKGMAPEDLAEYNARFMEEGAPLIHHIGLGNLNQRMRLLFGDACHLTLVQTPGGGLTVHLPIPFHTAADGPEPPLS